MGLINPKKLAKTDMVKIIVSAVELPFQEMDDWTRHIEVIVNDKVIAKANKDFTPEEIRGVRKVIGLVNGYFGKHVINMTVGEPDD